MKKNLQNYEKELANLWLKEDGMIFKNGILKTEEDEPAMRSCWECNGAHERLKTVNFLHSCFECGRDWIFDTFLDKFINNDEIIEWLKSLGVKEGESTKTIDKGYRVIVITKAPWSKGG